MNDSKRPLIYSRLARRLRTLNLSGFDAYCDLLGRGDSRKIENFVNAITTNLTAFFRENHHFEFLRQVGLPHLQEVNAAKRSIRIWSAGCSTGEEPYSIAMTVLETLARPRGWTIEILATDIDSNVLAAAAAGIYAPARQQGLDAERQRRWFTPVGCAPGHLRVKQELRQMIRFTPLNLVEMWPVCAPFDAIVCRNVAIYFDQPTRGRLFERFADVLAPHGYLFIGHSESMLGICTRFDMLGHTIYRPATAYALERGAIRQHRASHTAQPLASSLINSL